MLSSLINAACTKDQVMRITYETLRQGDCHRNSVRTDYCDRSYTFEYAEYKHIREGFLQQVEEKPELAMTEPTLFDPLINEK